MLRIAKILGLFLLLAAGIPLALATETQTLEVPFGNSGSAWKLHVRFTDKGNNFRYSEYRRYRKNGTFKVLFKSTTGKVSKKQLREFRLMRATDMAVIPESLITIKQVEAVKQSVPEVCALFGSPEGCLQKVLGKSGFDAKTKKQLQDNPSTKLFATLWVPKSYTAVKKQAKEKKKNPPPPPSPGIIWWIVGLAFVIVIVSLILIALVAKSTNNTNKASTLLNQSTPANPKKFKFRWPKIPHGIIHIISFIPPLYGRAEQRNLVVISEQFIECFNKRRDPGDVYTGSNKLYRVAKHISIIKPVATIRIRNNTEFHANRPFYKFIGIARDEAEEIIRLLGATSIWETSLEVKSEQEVWVKIKRRKK